VLISCVVGEECPTIGLSYTWSIIPLCYEFRVGKEGLMLGFKDHFKGSDDKV